MPREPAVLHADVDSFFASVEQRDEPSLRARPVIVGGGVVLAASYEAKACGVRGGMGGAKARRLCPDAVVVDPRFSAYVDASRALFAVFEETAPVVEGLGLEEAFLDVSGLERISGSPAQIARRLRAQVRRVVGLPISVGAGRTKIVAKMASRAAKPDGLLVVAAADERAFLHPLPLEALWGVGPATARKLRSHGLETVGQLARLSERTLISILGKATGRHVHALAHNRDHHPVRPNRGRRSFGSQHALGRSRKTPAAIDAIAVSLVDRVTRRMRSSGRAGRTVVLRLRFDDFTRGTRSRTLPESTAATETILAALRELIAAARPEIERRGLTLVGVTVANLDSPGGGTQLALPFGAPGHAALDAAIDQVRERFGSAAVSRAVQLRADPRLSPWLRPDDY